MMKVISCGRKRNHKMVIDNIFSFTVKEVFCKYRKIVLNHFVSRV